MDVVGPVGILGVVSPDEAKDCTLEATPGMSGGSREVEVEVH